MFILYLLIESLITFIFAKSFSIIMQSFIYEFNKNLSSNFFSINSLFFNISEIFLGINSYSLIIFSSGDIFKKVVSISLRISSSLSFNLFLILVITFIIFDFMFSFISCTFS